jgi:hypothetical protein
MYSIEVTTKKGLDTQVFYNHGTKYRIEHKLSLDALKTLSDYDFVLNVKGSYIGHAFI